DADGRIEWKAAPDSDMVFVFHAKGYMTIRDFLIHPSSDEQTITLSPALVVFGTVRDVESGDAIPQFQIIGGWPRLDVGRPDPASGRFLMVTNAYWSSFQRDWHKFSKGEF